MLRPRHCAMIQLVAHARVRDELDAHVDRVHVDELVGARSQTRRRPSWIHVHDRAQCAMNSSPAHDVIDRVHDELRVAVHVG